jgi:hypothetical protein
MVSSELKDSAALRNAHQSVFYPNTFGATIVALLANIRILKLSNGISRKTEPLNIEGSDSKQQVEMCVYDPEPLLFCRMTHAW